MNRSAPGISAAADSDRIARFNSSVTSKPAPPRLSIARHRGHEIRAAVQAVMTTSESRYRQKSLSSPPAPDSAWMPSPNRFLSISMLDAAVGSGYPQQPATVARAASSPSQLRLYSPGPGCRASGFLSRLPMRTSRLGLMLPVFAAALSAAGCGGSLVVKTGDGNAADTNLGAIGRMYAQAELKLGRPPKSADELKPFVSPGTDFKQLLVSPNDNQPYVIVWAVNVVSTPEQSMVFAYERAGANGFRRVLTPSGTLMLGEDDFAKATFPPGHKPAGQ
jgi:hypothetical protein